MRSRALWILLVVCAACHRDERSLAPMMEVDPLVAARAGEAQYQLQAWHENVLGVRKALGCADTTNCCDVVLRRVRDHRGDLALDIQFAADELVSGSAPATKQAALAVATPLRHLEDMLISGNDTAGGEEDVAKTCHDVTDALDTLFDSGEKAWQDEVRHASH